MIFKGDIELLKPVADAWDEEDNGDKFGFKVETATFVESLRVLRDNDNSLLLVLMQDSKPVGVMGLIFIKSPLSDQLLAQEHFWYVMPEHRGRLGSLRMIDVAQKIAKDMGCSHLMMTASNLASELHDKVCRIYELYKMAKFETTYICSLKE